LDLKLQKILPAEFFLQILAKERRKDFFTNLGVPVLVGRFQLLMKAFFLRLGGGIGRVSIEGEGDSFTVGLTVGLHLIPIKDRRFPVESPLSLADLFEDIIHPAFDVLRLKALLKIPEEPGGISFQFFHKLLLEGPGRGLERSVGKLALEDLDLVLD